MRRAMLALAVFVWGCGGAVAAEGPHYPPYPEVWGREMPWPSHVREWQAPSVHERDDGEILIAFRDHEFPPSEPADDIEESGVLEFFGGTLTMGPDAFNAAITHPQMTDDVRPVSHFCPTSGRGIRSQYVAGPHRRGTMSAKHRPRVGFPYSKPCGPTEDQESLRKIGDRGFGLAAFPKN